LFTLNGRAEDLAKESSKGEKSTVRIGVDLHYFAYDEPGVMEESGLLYGLSGSFEHLADCNLFIDLSGSIVAGDLKYDGKLVNADGTEHPMTADTPNTIFNLWGTGGMLFECGDYSFIPYSGIGYRFLVDDLEEASSTYGYTREQTYVYLPVGVGLFRRMQASWLLDCRMEYRIMLDSYNRSHGGVLGGSVVLPQDSGSGFSASIGLSRPDGATSKFRMETFVETWNVDDSEVVSGYIEPENKSFLFGMRCSLCFS
jgi:hypothetical protein